MNNFRLTGTLVVLVGLLAALIVPVAAQDDTDTDVPPPQERPTLGIAFSNNDGDARITQVAPGGPADDAGLVIGDIITAVDGEPVDAETLALTIWGYDPGDTISLTVTRDEDSLDLEITLGEPNMMRGRDGRAPQLPNLPGMQPFLGIGLDGDADNATVDEVAEGSAAEDAGLLTGDVIIAIDDTPTATADEVISAISAYIPGDTIRITVERAGNTEVLEATLGTRSGFDVRPLPPLMGGTTFDYLPDENAWEVVEITPNSPASEAGLQIGDRITAIDGESLDQEALLDLLPQLINADNVILTVERDDDTLEITTSPLIVFNMLGMANFERMPDGFEFRGPGNRGFEFPDDRRFEFTPPMMNRVRLGVAFTTLDADIAAENDLEITEGALVTEVLPGSPAEEAGLLTDDVITAVEGDVVDAARTLPERLFPYDPGDTITLSILRDGDTLEIEVTLADAVRVPPPDVVPAMPETDDNA